MIPILPTGYLPRPELMFWSLFRDRPLHILQPRPFLFLLMLSLLPGAASAVTVEIFNISRPDIVIPVILLMEIPFAIWVSGFMGAADRRSIRKSFSRIVNFDFSGRTAGEILAAFFWGEDSITVFIFRIWLAVITAMLCTAGLNQVENIVLQDMAFPPLGLLMISFSFFSYIFIRNLCEETISDQMGHASLAVVFCGGLFLGVSHFY